MIEDITLACQLIVLAMLIGITWFGWQTRKNVQKTADLITQYRREVEWLGARIDMLERSRQSQKMTSSK
jgi:hypothetical protein